MIVCREKAIIYSLSQRQQEELRRRQQEMYELHQRQLATAELARKQSEARAAAEGELAAQQVGLVASGLITVLVVFGISTHRVGRTLKFFNPCW